MEESDAAVPANFTLLVDKAIGGAVKELKWCPTMDLLALVNSKEEVWIQRAGSGSSWTRLLSLTSPSNHKTTSIAWRSPDGKEPAFKKLKKKN